MVQQKATSEKKMKRILVICVVLAAFSSESFSQSIDLTPRVTPVKGDTLFTWNQAQAKEIGVLLSERNSFRSELNLNDSLMGVYRSQVGELTLRRLCLAMLTGLALLTRGISLVVSYLGLGFGSLLLTLLQVYY